MRRALWVTAALALAWFPGARPAAAGDDFQTWHTVELRKGLTSKWEVFFLPEIRIRDDSSELFYRESRQGVRFSPSKHLTLGLQYLFVRSENAAGKHRDEHTGEIDVTPKATLGPLQLSLRWRLALRTIQGSSGEQEYQMRFMPKAAWPTRLGNWKLTPYVADDLFYDYTRDAFNQNRFFLGISLPLKEFHGAKNFLDLYYMLQHQLGSTRDWSSNHVLGSKLTIQF